ncbi:hypothetical protein [Spiroplasma endosymbiont of Zeiraphera isertana]|uniref:hypothetical protein n=1 Tax=Spiroplasma endosymbiont of Zeiraphera isertana TaxID=3066313 RepID=UPI00313E4F30
MKYDLIIGIDPAGIGDNGIVIYSNENNNIVFNETFKTKTVLETKNIYKEYFKLIKAFLPLCTIFKFYHINAEKSLSTDFSSHF